MQRYYIFITGGVLSGLGKGIITASIGKLLQIYGHTVTAIKIDPYINFDAGTMRPTEHGEVWVTEDGGEIDQDLGNYERFLNLDISKDNNITTGKIFSAVIEKERAGKYLGQTVQPIPHVTNEIKHQIDGVAKETLSEIVLIEVGGVVGDYENILYLEAARQLKLEGHPVIFVHVTYLPVPEHTGEMKSKPTQHSVKELQSLGIQPDFIMGRSKYEIDDIRKRKLALFCNTPENFVVSVPDTDNIYEVPLILEKQGVTQHILDKFNLKSEKHEDLLKKWQAFVDSSRSFKKEIKIGIIGKYFDIGNFSLVDSYISVIEAIKHACWNNNVKHKTIWVDSKEFEKNERALDILRDMDAIIVPGGFGSSGTEGKIAAINYVRENNIPFLGLCYGMQLAIIEYARNVCGLKGAHSTEIDKSTIHPVVDVMPEQVEVIRNSRYGASMRLGAWPANLKKFTLVWNLYGKLDQVSERHRHRFEMNPAYVKKLEENGLIFSGWAPGGKLADFLELKDHIYFVATQAHPEFKSRPMKPAPLFDGLIKAALKRSSKN